MKKILVVFLMLQAGCFAAIAQTAPQVTTVNGVVEGITDANGIRIFMGIPFAQPPVGDLRWKEPQPVQNWDGVRKADHFGPQAMQKKVFADMVFRSAGSAKTACTLMFGHQTNQRRKSCPCWYIFMAVVMWVATGPNHATMAKALPAKA